MKVEVKLPPKLIPVFLGSARYRGAYGGRGSAKTRSFAKMSAITAHRAAQSGKTGIVLCVRQFMNSLADSSMAEVKAAIESEAWLRPYFDIGESYIRTACGRVEFSFIGLARNLNNIKSKAKIILCWADEADPITEEAWEKLIPSVREHESEIWVTWNPENEESPVDKRFRNNAADDVKIIEMNYQDNPWFPDVLERERLEDKLLRPDNYGHIWDGEYKTHFVGAYFSEGLREAKDQGRIGRIGTDKLLRLRAYCDIGGVGLNADAFTMWVCQFVGKEIRILNYYEAQGQELSGHVHWLNQNGYPAGSIDIYLPHDGKAQKGPYAGTWTDAFRDAGYTAEPIENAGSGQKGAPLIRIEAVRRLLPQMWFDETKTEFGRKRLAAYHEKRDADTGRGLGPNHDKASHGADAFGLMAVAYEEPKIAQKIKYNFRGVV